MIKISLTSRHLLCAILLAGVMLSSAGLAEVWIAVDSAGVATPVDTESPGVHAMPAPTHVYDNFHQTFNVAYEDVELHNGIGFNETDPDPYNLNLSQATFRQLCQQHYNFELDYGYEGPINIRVFESEMDGTGPMVRAGTYFRTTPGFTNGKAFEHLTTGVDPAPEIPDIFITVDFGYPLAVNGPWPDRYDLGTAMHRCMLRALGFLSLADSDGSSLVAPNVYSVWDSFLETGNGLRLFSGSPPSFQGTANDLLGLSNGIRFVGPILTGAFSGVAAAVYAPNPHEPGLSLSYWDLGIAYFTARMEHVQPFDYREWKYSVAECCAFMDLGLALELDLNDASEGVNFVVKAGSEGMAGTAVNGDADPANDIYRGGGGTNEQRLSQYALGLATGDQIDALSYGNCPITIDLFYHPYFLDTEGRSLHFYHCVDSTFGGYMGAEHPAMYEMAAPSGGTATPFAPADPPEHIGDVYQSMFLGMDESYLGLAVAVDHENDDIVAVDVRAAPLNRGSDPLQPGDLYFSLAEGSPSLVSAGVSAADILTPNGSGGFKVAMAGDGVLAYDGDAASLSIPMPGNDLDALFVDGIGRPFFSVAVNIENPGSADAGPADILLPDGVAGPDYIDGVPDEIRPGTLWNYADEEGMSPGNGYDNMAGMDFDLDEVRPYAPVSGVVDQTGSELAECGLYSSSDVPQDISVFPYPESVLTVPEHGTITDVNVMLNITCPSVGAVLAQLTSPEATTVDLVWSAGAGADFVNTVLDDEAGTSVDLADGPCSGFYVPHEALSAFDGEEVQGDWTLTAGLFLKKGGEKLGAPSTWQLDGWSLLFDCDVAPSETGNSVAVPWYIDIAGVAQRLPAEDGKVTTLVYLHNNQSNALLGFIEYYTQDGVYVGPDANAFTIPADASVAFRPVADDPASVMGGQEADVGLAIPNRPLGTEGGNDNKKNGSIVIRWFGDSTDIQGQALTYHNKAENGGPYSFSALLPQGIGPQTGGVSPCAVGVPWYVDIAGEAQGLPAADGKVTALVYLHNNLDETLNCVIEYYTKDGIYIGPTQEDAFTIDPNASIAFRPVADDPSSVQGGQEGVPGRAVPNRPMGTEGGNDDKKNGSIVIRWEGRPTDVQGMVTSYRKIDTGPYVSSVLLPPGNASAK